jgi:hypothetical protein
MAFGRIRLSHHSLPCRKTPSPTSTVLKFEHFADGGFVMDRMLTGRSILIVEDEPLIAIDQTLS